jgi:probable HAF family extracellular repeat protein
VFYPHAFLYDANVADPKMQDLGTLGGNFSAAYGGINDANKVVGRASTGGDTANHAFLYDANAADPKMQDLGTLGGSNSLAWGINEANKVVGDSYTSGDSATHAFLYDANTADPKMQDLGTLGGSVSSAQDINEANKVVGTSSTSGDWPYHAFLSSDGVMRDLNSLISANSGWELFEAKAINDNDYIVGTGVKDGQQHAVLLTPDPTPPQVASTNPKDGATGVGRSEKVTATFSEQMDPTTLTDSTVQLFSRNSKNPIKAPLTIGSTTNSEGQTVTTVTLTPSQKLDAKTQYKLLIHGGANSPVVRDLAGNALASDFVARFTTGSQ